MNSNILVTGAAGQIGTELTRTLRSLYGDSSVVAADYKPISTSKNTSAGPTVILDVANAADIAGVVKKYGIRTIYHLAGVLSAVAEKNPQLAWNINVNGLKNILETACQNSCAVFFPSSIGAFGPGSPADNTPQVTIQRPTSIYGITKLTGELLCEYYYKKFGVDTRGLRFPGIISYETLPGGGTTDYAVDIFYSAVAKKTYSCFLQADTALDMMYMPDALTAAIDLMEADGTKLIHRNAYNITAMSLTPAMLAREITKHIPGFSITYSIDPVRQQIADSWPNKLDDNAARKEWGWNPQYGLAEMTKDMITHISAKQT
ncbi:MAG: NAD-dependent epimerase/dehydratase family protein [Desulfamplus sp.]|nr:NAD-dependent epimerase/dehydratase family protein [Desulfamplus sp.]